MKPPFDPVELEKMIQGRYVRTQDHPTMPYRIYNYTELAQFEHVWNEVTLNCRGLIMRRETGDLIARGFRKFFNWDDTSQPYPPNGPVLRSPKMDGSLGILYPTIHGNVSVATRGSLTSDQAQWASEYLHELHMGGEIDLFDLNPLRYSYLVEIIYPDNRIVVNYGNQERLVLLDVLDTATGKTDLDEFERVFWLDKVDRKYFPGGFTDGFVHDIPEGDEGFVVYWPGSDYRVKMKAAEYLELHRMIFSLSERSIWQRLGDGEQIQDICVKLPDEFHAWVSKVGVDLFHKQTEVSMEVQKAYGQIAKYIPHSEDSTPADRRKVFAQHAVRHPLRAYLFMMYDGKSPFAINDAIWKTLRPEGNKGVVTISEDVA